MRWLFGSAVAPRRTSALSFLLSLDLDSQLKRTLRATFWGRVSNSAIYATREAIPLSSARLAWSYPLMNLQLPFTLVMGSSCMRIS